MSAATRLSPVRGSRLPQISLSLPRRFSRGLATERGEGGKSGVDLVIAQHGGELVHQLVFRTFMPRRTAA